MEEMKKIVATNLVSLRTAAGMTQSELGERLMYSDKSVSKWERAEALPDVVVLKKIGEIFGVSVDYLIKDHSEEKGGARPSLRTYSRTAVVLMAVVCILTAALLAFIIVWILVEPIWLILLYAACAATLTAFVFNCIWGSAPLMIPLLSSFVVSVLVAVYFTFPERDLWQIFLLIPAAVLTIFLATKIRKRQKK